jgi:hypothetical protein
MSNTTPSKMSRRKKVALSEATLDTYYKNFRKSINNTMWAVSGVVGSLISARYTTYKPMNRFFKFISVMSLVPVGVHAKSAMYNVISANKFAKDNNIPDYVDVDLGVYQGTGFGKWFYLPTDSPVYYVGSYLYPDLAVENNPTTDLNPENKVKSKAENKVDDNPTTSDSTSAFKVVQYVDPDVELYVDPDLDIKDLCINPDNEPSDPPSSK